MTTIMSELTPQDDNFTTAAEEERPSKLFKMSTKDDELPMKDSIRSGEKIINEITTVDPSIKPNNNQNLTSRDYYFDSYSHHGIHEEMLKDQVRTRTYQRAILDNAHLFRDKIVLDVGCGTCILSMFAVQAGARHVYAVDCSSIVELAKKIVDKNGFSQRITVIRGLIEEVELPYIPSTLESSENTGGGDEENTAPKYINQVDIIISEWMGYFLLYESMLKTVIFARDKWLVPGGIIFPDKAVMYVCAVEDASAKNDRIEFWKDVYGFDMTPIRDVAMQEAIVDVIGAKAVCTNVMPIHRIDILTCTEEALSFTSSFHLLMNRNDYVHGLAVYFECAFTQVHKPVGFSTSPFVAYTHWKQTLFYLEEALTCCKGEEIHGTLSCKPNAINNRDLDITITIQFQGNHSVSDSLYSYRLR